MKDDDQIVVVITAPRVEQSLTLPKPQGFRIVNLSSEIMYASRVSGRVVRKGGVWIPGGAAFDSGELEETGHELYFTAMQPQVKFLVSGSKNVFEFERMSLRDDQGAYLVDDQGNRLRTDLV